MPEKVSKFYMDLLSFTPEETFLYTSITDTFPFNFRTLTDKNNYYYSKELSELEME